MDQKTIYFCKFFILPTVIAGGAFTSFSAIYPDYNYIWLGLLMTFTLSAIVMVWAETMRNREQVDEIRDDLTGHSKVYRSYDSLMSFAESLIARPSNNLETVFVFMGYNHKLSRSDRYLKRTIEAIESGRIDKYYRIVTLRTEGEIDDVIEFLKSIASSEVSVQKTRFFISYQATANYMSFLVIGEEDCIISVPDLADAPELIATHKCGTYAKDSKLVAGLTEVFNEIRRQGYTEKVDLVSLVSDPSNWDKFKEEISARYQHYKQ